MQCYVILSHNSFTSCVYTTIMKKTSISSNSGNDSKRLSSSGGSKKQSISSEGKKVSTNGTGYRPAERKSKEDKDIVKSDDEMNSEEESEDDLFDGSETQSEIDEANESWRDLLWKVLIEYGPPYVKPDPLVVAPFSLIGECSEYNCSLRKVHNYLNMRIDPNERDPDDLYFTAMHWCVRNCHLAALKLLKVAGADLNLLNEFGTSNLSITTFFSCSNPCN